MQCFCIAGRKKLNKRMVEEARDMCSPKYVNAGTVYYVKLVIMRWDERRKK